MAKKIKFDVSCSDSKLPRIGGGALFGDSTTWPTAPDGRALTLIASIPTDFLNQALGLTLPDKKYISVLSYYTNEDYFLDSITYHGTQEELTWIKKGFTRVLIHDRQDEVHGPVTIPPMEIFLEDSELDNEIPFGRSKIGGTPYLLQAEPLALENENFILQLYGGDFPKSYQGIFGLSDAIGYVFVNLDKIEPKTTSDLGTFFVQVT